MGESVMIGGTSQCCRAEYRASGKAKSLVVRPCENLAMLSRRTLMGKRRFAMRSHIRTITFMLLLWEELMAMLIEVTHIVAGIADRDGSRCSAVADNPNPMPRCDPSRQTLLAGRLHSPSTYTMYWKFKRPFHCCREVQDHVECRVTI